MASTTQLKRRRRSNRWLSKCSAPLVITLLIGLCAMSCSGEDPLDAIERQHQAGDFATSVEPMRELLAERRDDARLLFLYGRALSATATPTEALWALQAAMEDPQHLVPAGLIIAAGAYRMRNFTVALEALDAILAEHPDHLDALLLRADTLAAQRIDYEQALADAERVLEVAPDNVKAVEPKILALLGLERIDEAAEAMEALGEMIRETQLSEDGLAWHCATMAIFANDSGHVDLARERWMGCLEEFPSHSEVVGKAVGFFDAQQEWGTSLEILRGAVEDAPDAIAYRVGLAVRLRASGAADEAEQVLLEATRANATPQLQIRGWLGLVTHHQALDAYAQAAEAAGRAVEVAGGAGTAPPQLLFDHADALVMAGEYDAAAEVAEAISVPAYRELVLGRSLLQQGEPEGALEHFTLALTLWPDNAYARYYAALAAEEIGDFDRAIEEYRYSMRIDAGATDARLRLGRLHAAEGRPTVALQILRTKTHELPLDLEGELLSIELFAWAGNRSAVTSMIASLRRRSPTFARYIAHVARGLERRAGPNAALRAIETTAGLRLHEPIYFEALHAWVEISLRADDAEAAVARVETALAEHPRHARLHALHAEALALSGAGEDRVRAACARALELGPDDVRALTCMGDRMLDVDTARALELFERAHRIDPEGRAARFGTARALSRLDRSEEARSTLEALLRDEPYDLEVARMLVALERARSAPPERVERLQARLERFSAAEAPVAPARVDAHEPATAEVEG